MIEYPVKIKFTYDNSELKKINDKVGVGGKSEGETSKKSENSLMGILKSVGIIAILIQSLQQILQPILQIIQILVFVAIVYLIKRVGEIINAFTALFSGDLIGFLKGILGEDFFNFIIAWLEEGWAVMKDIGQWLWDNILVPPWNLILTIGQWLWDNIFVPAWNILLGIGQWIWDNILVPAWEVLLTIGQWLWDNIFIPAWEVLLEIGQWIWDNILVPAFNFLAPVGEWIWKQIIEPAWNFLKDVGSWIWEQIIKPAFSFLKNIGTWVWDLVKSAFGGKKEGTKAYGGTIPETGMYMMHAGETVSRGNTSSVTNSPVINLNISGGNLDNDMVEKIARRMTRELNSYMKW